MAAHPQVIEAELLEPATAPAKRSRVEAAAERARSIADTLERVGFRDLSARARHAATTLDRAQAVADATRPAVSALARLTEALEESGILRHAPRTLGKRAP